MDIAHPRRILLLSSSSTDTPCVLSALVPSYSPSAILTDELVHEINTAYYTAKIPIWQDTISDVEAWASEWKDMQGASDVVSAVGAWILAFERPRVEDGLTQIKALLRTISSTISHHTTAADPYSEAAEALLLAIGLPQHQLPALDLSSQDWDDICQDAGGWEYVDAEAKGKNEFGELQGLPRMLEALQAAEWDNAGAVDAGAEEDFDEWLEELERHDLNDDQVQKVPRPLAGVDGDIELQAELHGMLGGVDESELQQPILDSKNKAESTSQQKPFNPDELVGEGEDGVEDLQRMLLKLQAARDLGADLPQAERRKLAAQAVKEVMKM